MTRIATVAVALALAANGGGCAYHAPADHARLGAQHKLAEDSPGWDCRTMGNRRCGRR